MPRVSHLIRRNGVYAKRFLSALISQAAPSEKAGAVKLDIKIDAWRRAQRSYGLFFN